MQVFHEKIALQRKYYELLEKTPRGVFLRSYGRMYNPSIWINLLKISGRNFDGYRPTELQALMGLLDDSNVYNAYPG